jgi:hypothetical protein
VLLFVNELLKNQILEAKIPLESSYTSQRPILRDKNSDRIAIQKALF